MHRIAALTLGAAVFVTAAPAPGALETLGDACTTAPAAWKRAEVPIDRDAMILACAFSGRRHAWVGVIAERDPAPVLRVFRTRDGGRTWLAVGLGAKLPRLTTWAGFPELTFRFTDARSGQLEVRDLPQNHNLHVETKTTFATHDGGATWRFVRTRRRCFDLPNRCTKV